MLVGAAIVRVLFVVAAAQSSQPAVAQASNGLILGRVVDAGTGRPVSGAIVSLNGGGVGSPRAMTNANGQFVFRKVPKGQFILNATKPGYVEGAYGRRAPGGTTRSLVLDDGQRVGDVSIAMWRHAAIRGTVVDEVGEPLIGISVRVFRRLFVAGQPRYNLAGMAATDDRGMYRAGGLIPGDYVVAFLSRQVSMPPEVADILRNPPPPSDTKGQALMQARMSLGGPFLGVPGTSSGMQIGSTIRQLDASAPVPPISAELASPVFIYPTMFFPNAPTGARAGVITLQSGQERDGVDLSLHPVRASRVSGSVIGADGPASYVAVHLAPGADETIPELDSAATMTDANGNFTLTGVVAGQWVLKAARIPRAPAPALPSNIVTTQIQVGGGVMVTSSLNDAASLPPIPPIPNEPALYADVPIAVADADVKDVIVPLQRGGSVSGRVEFDGTADRPDADALSRIGILLNSLDNGPLFNAGFVFSDSSLGRVEATGAFKTYGQAPGRYVLRTLRVPSGWTLKSATVQGRDIADAPFEIGAADIGNVVITFTDRPTKLTGSARTKDGNPDADAVVVAFPSDPSGWTDSASRRLRIARPGSDGMFTFIGLPAGDYYIAAILEGAPGQWQNPDLLAEIARSATQVRLVEGETKTQDVVRSGGDR